MTENHEYESQTSIGGTRDAVLRGIVLMLGIALVMKGCDKEQADTVMVGLLLIDRAYMLFRWRLM